MTSKYIGITSTVPSEVIFASGHIPVDLNNIFVSSTDPAGMVKTAESAGFPVNYCAWIKGIYGALKSRPDIKTVVSVCQGDCGNTTALTDLLVHEGYEVIPFSYPPDANIAAVQMEVAGFASRLNTSLQAAETAGKGLEKARLLARKVDDMTWRENLISGEENHLALVNSSDFNGDPDAYASGLQNLIQDASLRDPFSQEIRLGLAGVPPIVSDIYARIERGGARVVYNEVQYAFAMTGEEKTLAERYAAYPYPYGVSARAAIIKREIDRRGIKGLIHYVQSFCYHQLDDIVIRETAGVPVLRMEADKPGLMDERTAVRLEAFIETLS